MRHNQILDKMFREHNVSFFSFSFLQTIIFPSLELESKWVAAVLSGQATLPSEEDMMASVLEHYRKMEEAGIPKRHTHVIMPEWVCELRKTLRTLLIFGLLELLVFTFQPDSTVAMTKTICACA